MLLNNAIVQVILSMKTIPQCCLITMFSLGWLEEKSRNKEYHLVKEKEITIGHLIGQLPSRNIIRQRQRNNTACLISYALC